MLRCHRALSPPHPDALLGQHGPAWQRRSSRPPAFQSHLPPVNGDTPQQVAETLDRLVQPRFQQNAGAVRHVPRRQPGRPLRRSLFGDGDRRMSVVCCGGSMPPTAPSSSPSCIVRHKPGAHVNPKTPPEATGRPFSAVRGGPRRPSVRRRRGADRNMDWADKNLTRVVLPSLPALRRGQGRTVDYQNWLVVMRPVLATHAACVGCHAGAQARRHARRRWSTPWTRTPRSATGTFTGPEGRLGRV